MGASVVTGCDASPALELCEEVLPHVALAIEHFVVDAGDFSASAWGECGLDAFGRECLAERSAIVAGAEDSRFKRPSCGGSDQGLSA